jgi:predicted nucleotidyltransferase
VPLQDREREAIDCLVEKCRTHFGPRLFHAFLFGSKARGDDGFRSDVDILIVLNGDIDEVERAAISRMAYEVLDSCGLYLHVLALSAREFEHPEGELRWLTSFVREEGKAL